MERDKGEIEKERERERERERFNDGQRARDEEKYNDLINRHPFLSPNLNQF